MTGVIVACALGAVMATPAWAPAAAAVTCILLARDGAQCPGKSPENAQYRRSAVGLSTHARGHARGRFGGWVLCAQRAKPLAPARVRRLPAQRAPGLGVGRAAHG